MKEVKVIPDSTGNWELRVEGWMRWNICLLCSLFIASPYTYFRQTAIRLYILTAVWMYYTRVTPATEQQVTDQYIMIQIKSE